MRNVDITNNLDKVSEVLITEALHTSLKNSKDYAVLLTHSHVC